MYIYIYTYIYIYIYTPKWPLSFAVILSAVYLVFNSVQKALKDLCDKYVITPIDKANYNMAFICKRFYALSLSREPGMTYLQSTNTYEHSYEYIWLIIITLFLKWRSFKTFRNFCFRR